MLVLGIESTCDETAAALVADGKTIIAQSVASQIDLHNIYGGVVPELACRRHIDAVLPVIKECLRSAKITLNGIDLIAVANGPGLIGALLIGLNAAKALAFALEKPLIGVNHVEAHLYAALMASQDTVAFPCLGLVLSGGHTLLLLVKGVGQYELIGHTVDDAIGEAFDKVAKLLSLPYPGGPEIEKLAKNGNPKRFAFKAGQVKGAPFHFSFSGLKTAVMYKVNGENLEDPSLKSDIAASFQRAAVHDVLEKTLAAASKHGCNTVLFGGGVVNNRYLKETFYNTQLKCLFPSADLTLDNAAMIAGLGFHHFQNQGPSDLLNLQAKTRISLTQPAS